MVLNTLIGVSLVGLDLGFVWATKLAIDVATGHTQVCSLAHAFLLIAVLMASRILLSLSSRWIRAILGVKAQNSMCKHILDHLLRSRWSKVKAYHTGNLTNRTQRDVNDVVHFVTEVVPSFITTCTQFAGAFFFLFYMDHTLALIIVCLIPFFVLSSKLYIRKVRELSHKARETESTIQAVIQETLQHVLVVKTMQRIGYFIQILSGQQDTLHRYILRRTRYSTISSTLLNVGFGTGYFVTFAWGASSLQAGTISYGAMLAFIQLVGQIQNPVRELSRFVPVFINSFTAAERLMDIEDLEIEDDTEPCKLQGPLGIRLQDVSFRYTDTSRWVFEKFNVRIRPGEIVALVGETGAGKTTFIRLLFSLMTPGAGEVYLTDSKGAEYRLRPHLRGNFAYVPQGNTLFSGTIRSNLLQGNPSATEDQMHEALMCAAAEFVYRKPQGLDTPCGETGDGLSEGQSQRIAIARALLSDGGVLVFDEATSSLDPETEKTVLQRIVKKYAGRTMLFITHRPEVLNYATQTIRLSGN